MFEDKKASKISSATGRNIRTALCPLKSTTLMQDAGDSDQWIVDDNLAFSKDRTVSRLTEMESREYLMSHARKHVPCLVLALEEEGGAEKSKKETVLEAATA